jgi:hypothetical protein
LLIGINQNNFWTMYTFKTFEILNNIYPAFMHCILLSIEYYYTSKRVNKLLSIELMTRKILKIRYLRLWAKHLRDLWLHYLNMQIVFKFDFDDSSASSSIKLVTITLDFLSHQLTSFTEPLFVRSCILNKLVLSF